eukprot:CAMPEP_0119137932 /NCGR_PEP_ID=MMETSP1310-20130426/24667_1 /TAXON_ID=464262 /ORGANISM="Genus nov. species nov., Strain RCC2339" /LENGTH=338 /DNA_ID=CAMNT_0007129077 /DNA_START=68 /DNA_END=1085 /DNA_ORIENTATION=+
MATGMTAVVAGKVGHGVWDYGGHSQQGMRSHMEDTYILHDEKDYGLYGVFDGHGGHRTSETARDSFNSHFKASVGSAASVGEALQVALDATEAEYAARYPGNDGFEGSTAVVAAIREGKVTIANLGDSRCVICRKGRLVLETKDHKPDDPAEQKRIEALHGVVRHQDTARIYRPTGGDPNARRTFPASLLVPPAPGSAPPSLASAPVGGGAVAAPNHGAAGRGGLALSRALGDLFYEEVVPTNADIYEHTVGAEDDFIVIGSDGLWDVMSSQNACTFVTQYFNRYPDKSAEEGATAMVARALRLRSMDNVAAVVVRLSPPEEATEANAQACETPRARL